MKIVSNLGRVARAVGQKAGTVVEIGKLTARQHAEKTAIDRLKLEMGDIIWNRYLEGSETEASLTALCEKVRDSYAAMDILAAAIEELKYPEESDAGCDCGCACQHQTEAEVHDGPKCALCGAGLATGARFCAECGAEVE